MRTWPRTAAVVLFFGAAMACAADAPAAKAKPAPAARAASGVDRARAVVAPVVTPTSGYTVEPAPAWATAFDARMVAGTDPAPMQYRLIDEQVRLDGRRQEEFRHAVRIVNEASGLATAAQVEIVYDPAYESVALHHVDVVRDGRRSTRMDPRRIQVLQRETQLERRVVDGRMTISMVLEDVRVGDEIDIAYTQRGANPVFGGKFVNVAWMTSDKGPVGTYRHRLLAPADRAIVVKSLAREATVASQVTAGWRETIVQRERVRAFKPQPGASPQVVLDEQVFESEFASWSDVVQWGLDVFAEPPGPTPGIDERAQALRAAGDSPDARLLAAVEFVQKEVRYFATEAGPNSHRPAAPEKVLQQRFGDCKDKVSLLVALLKRMDIAAEPVLVSTFFRRKVAGMPATPLAFNHVVVRATVGGRALLLDGTRTHQTGPLDKRVSVGFGTGLALTASQDALVPLPEAWDELRMSVEDRFIVDAFDQPLRLEGRATYRGDLAELLRDAITNQGLSAVQARLVDSYTRFYPKAKLVGAVAVEPAGDDDAITLSIRLRFDDYWRYPEQRFLVGEVAAWSLVEAMRGPSAEGRRDPVGTLPGVYRHSIEFSFPVDAIAKPAHQELDDGDDHFALHVLSDSTSRHVASTLEMRMKVEEIPVDEWPAYVDRARAALPKLGGAIVVPPVPSEQLAALQSELQSIEKTVREGRNKPKTRVQAEAPFRIALLSRHIDGGRLPPANLVEALVARGVQLDYVGSPAKGEADLARALQLAPESVEALNAAAVNAMMLERFDRAVEYSERALKRQPHDVVALNSRALARYRSGDIAAARQDYEALLNERAAWQRGYPLVMWSLLQRRGGGEAPPAAARTREGDLTTEWPRPIVDWLRGKGDLDAVLAAARKGTTPAERLCEAYFYIGERYLAEGDSARAAEYYRKSVDQGMVEFVEHDMSRWRLAGLQARQ